MGVDCITCCCQRVSVFLLCRAQQVFASPSLSLHLPLSDVCSIKTVHLVLMQQHCHAFPSASCGERFYGITAHVCQWAMIAQTHHSFHREGSLPDRKKQDDTHSRICKFSFTANKDILTHFDCICYICRFAIFHVIYFTHQNIMHVNLSVIEYHWKIFQKWAAWDSDSLRTDLFKGWYLMHFIEHE